MSNLKQIKAEIEQYNISKKIAKKMLALGKLGFIVSQHNHLVPTGMEKHELYISFDLDVDNENFITVSFVGKSTMVRVDQYVSSPKKLKSLNAFLNKVHKAIK
jgi:hypothetical protein